MAEETTTNTETAGTTEGTETENTTLSLEEMAEKIAELSRAAQEAENKQKAAERALDFTKRDFSQFKKGHQTEAEQAEEKRIAAETLEKQLKTERNVMRAERLLQNAGISASQEGKPGDYDENFLGLFVSEDADITEDRFQAIGELVAAKSKAAVLSDREQRMQQNATKPPAGSENAGDAAFEANFTKALGL